MTSGQQSKPHICTGAHAWLYGLGNRPAETIPQWILLIYSWINSFRSKPQNWQTLFIKAPHQHIPLLLNSQTLLLPPHAISIYRNAKNNVALLQNIDVVYNHIALLSWLRKREGWTEILRPGATRFATTFIALKSLHDHKHDLQALGTSKFFVDSRYSKNNKSSVAISIILDNRFWNDCLIVVNLMSPLMRLLHIVDCDERSSMEYVYEGMYRACLSIKKII